MTCAFATVLTRCEGSRTISRLACVSRRGRTHLVAFATCVLRAPDGASAPQSLSTRMGSPA
eukprot:4670032-Alexandrium_andersonii.AAC.1